MKSLCFRFDIDTHKCIRDGVPNLLELAKRHNVKFTFFINLGRSVDRLQYLRTLFGKKENNLAKHLPTYYKLGLRDYLHLSIANPVIGNRYSKEITRILEEGHELGLHGGRNHQSWVVGAKSWSDLKIKNELMWAIDLFYNISNKKPIGFTSPGWIGSGRINKILSELGFKYVSDRHSNKPVENIEKLHGLKSIPTNIVGEPGGVGYIEYCRALKMTDDEILLDFEKLLNKRRKLAVIYDHPYYVGVREIKILDNMISIGQKLNYKIVTMSEVANIL